jgi:hypothetical protein
MLDSGELDKKEQSDALALHNPADAALMAVGKDVCNNTQSINKEMVAKEEITCLSHTQKLFDENLVRRYTAPELEVLVLTDNFDYFPIAKAWKVKKKINLKNNELSTRSLHLDKCRCGSIQLIVIGNEDYMHHLWNTLDWYPSEFIAGFMMICQDNAHVSTPSFKTDQWVMMVLNTYPGNKELIKDDIDYRDVTHYIAVVYNSSRSAVLYYNIAKCTVTVYDGLKYCITK